MPSKLSSTMELSVECSWYKHLHGRPVTALTVSRGDTLLYSACDLSAPRIGVSAVTADRQPAVAVLACRDGLLKGALHCAPDTVVSNVYVDDCENDARIWCIDGTGSAWTHSLPSWSEAEKAVNEVQMIAMWKVPTDTGMKKLVTSTNSEAVDDSGNDAIDCVPCDAQQQHLDESGEADTNKAILNNKANATISGDCAAQAPVASPSLFQKASGYRGVREGFVFRNGPWGKGYYSKELLAKGGMHTVAGHEDFPITAKVKGAQVEVASNAQDGKLLDENEATAGDEGQESVTAAAPAQLPRHLAVPEDVRKLRDHINHLAKPNAKIRFSLLTSDRQILVTGSCGLEDSVARIRMAKDGSLVCELRGHTGNVLEGTLSPDQCTLFTGAYDGVIKEWDLLTGKFVRELRGHRSGIRGLVVSPDSESLYSCAADNTIRHWDLSTGLCRRSFQGRHSDSTWPVCICMTPDGQLIATGSNGLLGESTIKIFHATGSNHRDAGKCLATICHFNEQKGSVSALTFSRDGKLLISAGTDGSVAAWRLTWGRKQLGRSELKGGFL